MPKDSSLESSTPFSSLPYMLYSLHDYTHTHQNIHPPTSSVVTLLLQSQIVIKLIIWVWEEHQNTIKIPWIQWTVILYNSTGYDFRIITFVIIHFKMIIVMEYDFTSIIYQQYLVKNLITTKKNTWNKAWMSVIINMKLLQKPKSPSK